MLPFLYLNLFDPVQSHEHEKQQYYSVQCTQSHVHEKLQYYSVQCTQSHEHEKQQYYSVQCTQSHEHEKQHYYSVHRFILLEQWIFKLLHNSIKYKQDGLNVVILFHGFMGFTIQI